MTKLTPTTCTLEENAALRELVEAEREAQNPIAALGIGLDLIVARQVARMVFRRRGMRSEVRLSQAELAAVAVVAIRRWKQAAAAEQD